MDRGGFSGGGFGGNPQQQSFAFGSNMAPAGGGFGGAPASGFGAQSTSLGFGTAHNAGFGNSTFPAFEAPRPQSITSTSGSFGSFAFTNSTMATSGGSLGGSGAAAVPTGSFGNAAAGTGFGAITNTGMGFGIGTNSGTRFGTGINMGTGFGASTSTGMGLGTGTSTGTGFGTSTNTGTGFGPSTNTGFVNPAPRGFAFGAPATASFGFRPSQAASDGDGGGAFGASRLNPSAPSFLPSHQPAAAKFGARPNAAWGGTSTVASAPPFAKKKPDASNSLFIKFSGEAQATERQLQEYFSRFGNVKSVSVRPNNGTAFVKMASVSDAQAAMSVPMHDFNMSVRWDNFANIPTSTIGGGMETEADQAGDDSDMTKRKQRNEREQLLARKAELQAKLAAGRGVNSGTTATMLSSRSKSRSPAQFLGVGDATTTQGSSFGNHGLPNEQSSTSTQKSATTSSRPLTPVMEQDQAAVQQGSSSFVVGRCTLMCPRNETQTRLQANQIDLLEQPHPELPHLGNDQEKLTIMKFQRSAAAEVLSVPEMIRTPEALEMTAQYIWKNILDIDSKGPDPRYRDSSLSGIGDRPTLLVVTNFVMDRIKRIIQEFGMQGYSQDEGPVSMRAVKVYEECARCHIILSFEMQEKHKDGEDWSERLNNESLNNTLKALLQMYKQADKTQAFVSPCEPEMQAYYMLLQLNAKEQSSNLIVQEIHKKWRKSPIVSLARDVYEAFHSGNFFAYFQTFKTAPYLLACLMRRGLDRMRNVGMRHLNGASHKDSRLRLDRFARFFCFDTTDDARAFCAHAGVQVVQGDDDHAFVELGGELRAASTGAPPRILCRFLTNKRDGIQRRMLVGDADRDWMQDDMRTHPQLASLRAEPEAASSKGHQHQRAPQITEKERLSLLEDSRKKTAEAAELEARRKRQQLEAEENQRKLADQERLVREQKRKEEEEALKKKQLQEAEELRKREELEKQERERLAEEQRKQEDERKRIQAQKQGLALERLFISSRSVASTAQQRRRGRTFLGRWRRTASDELQQLQFRAKALLAKCEAVLKSRALRHWRRCAQVEVGLIRMSKVLERICERRMWMRLKMELGNDIQYRERRFRKLLFQDLEAFPYISENACEHARMPASPLSNVHRLESQSSTFSLSFSTMPSIRRSFLVDLLDVNHRKFWKVCVLRFDKDLYSDFASKQTEFGRWVSRNVEGQQQHDEDEGGLQTRRRLFVSNISPSSTSQDIEAALAGVDAIVVAWCADVTMTPQERRERMEDIASMANKGVVSGHSCAGVPLLLLSPMCEQGERPDQNRMTTSHYSKVVVDPSTSHVQVVHKTENALRWLVSMSVAQVRRPIVQEVSFETFLLHEFPRLKWSRYGAPCEWLQEGKRLLVLAASKLEQSAVCTWPGKELLAAYPTEFPPYLADWNDPRRVQSQTNQILKYASALPVSYEFADIGIFANDVGMSATVFESLAIAARGDGLWLWEQVVSATLRSMVAADWVVYTIRNSGNEDIDNAPKPAHSESLIRCLREPPNASRNRPKNMFGAHEAIVKQPPPLKRGRSQAQEHDDTFEESLKMYLQADPTTMLALTSSGSPLKAMGLAVPTRIRPSDTFSWSPQALVQRAKAERLRQEDFLDRLNVISQLE